MGLQWIAFKLSSWSKHTIHVFYYRIATQGDSVLILNIYYENLYTSFEETKISLDSHPLQKGWNLPL